MPKLKTKSGAKKRFKVTGTGKIKRKCAFKNHILTKKETKQKRRLGTQGFGFKGGYEQRKSNAYSLVVQCLTGCWHLRFPIGFGSAISQKMQ